MQGNNPVFARNEAFSRGGYATFDTPTPSADELRAQYEAPSAIRAGTSMTYNDVITKTALLFGVFLLTAVPTYFLMPPEFIGIAWIGGIVVTLGLGLAIAFMKTVRPPLILLYAALQGVFVGAISQAFASLYDGIVAQAIIGTLAAFAAMLVAYSTGLIKVGSRFRKVMTFAIIGYLILGLVNLGAVLFTGFSLYFDTGLLGLGLSALGVLLASLSLALDFDFIEQGVRNRIPEQYSWLAAHGLLVTLVWLYLELLRLLAILRGSD
jgi:uncharacterized YccA/Bax inhibitor family protein